MIDKDLINKKKKKFKIRYLTLKDLDDFNNLLRYAFQVSNNELITLGYEVDEIKQAKSAVLSKAKVLGWFDGQKLASQIAVYPMKMNIHGVIYKMAGITGVATYPEYSNLGLMNDLMIKSIENMKKEGQTISVLYPYSIPFYRRKGWEIISDKMSFTIKDTQLPKTMTSKGRVERVSIDSDDLKELYNKFSYTRHGALIRGDLEWEEYWRWEVDDTIVALYYNDKNEAEGYLVYVIENDVFHIKEMIYLNFEARLGLWNYISAHFSMVDEVKGYNYTNEPIAFLLEDSEIKETIRPYIMARITDVKGFINNYPFLRKPKNKKINLIIKDDMAKWNNASFMIYWNEDKDTVCKRITKEYKRNSKDRYIIKMDIKTLTTMLMSYKSPSYLYRIGRIESTANAIKLLESIIPKEQVYFSDYF
ncbi:GNAT family N-acetyltransferase [Brachyspira pilosicoli]|uniref:GNAT family N-acetyltransferase n=1 Tax=Brachyspira pilosicoli TaxID=52584 RepID=UPI0030054ABD